MNKKLFFPIFCALLIVVGLLVINGCGSAASGGGGGGGAATTNYTISGKCAQTKEISSFSISSPPQKHITRIVAIGSNGANFSADINAADGSFSLGLVKGVPYVLGFYSGTNGTTLEGYLTVSSLGWDSLPLFDPTGEAIDLGTLTVEAGSLIVTCEISASALETAMDMASTANFYGEIDNAMVNYLNIDVNKDGIPDSEQGKSCYLTVDISGGPGITDNVPGQIPAMLTGYNTNYMPSPAYYQYWISGRTTDVHDGALGKLTAPQDLTDWSTNVVRTMTAEAKWTGNIIWWCSLRDDFNALFTAPPAPPSGTYTAEVVGAADKYTFDNCDFGGAYTIGSTKNIVYPVFHLNTYEADDGFTYISTVEYKWRVVGDDGITRDATDAEVKVVVVNLAICTGLISNQTPHIQFYPDDPPAPQGTCPVSYIYFDRDGHSLDLGTATINGAKVPPIKLSDVHRIKGAYTTSTNIQIEFWYGL